MSPLNEADEESTRPSKTQRKKESHAAQDLGEALLALPNSRWADLDLPERLKQALLDCQSITAHEGRRRQLQLIGKLMRGLDEPVLLQVRALCDHATRQSRDETKLFHRLEQWRQRLLDDDQAFTEWIHEFPDTDTQMLRSVIRSARKAREANLSPRAFRELFQLLKTHLTANE